MPGAALRIFAYTQEWGIIVPDAILQVPFEDRVLLAAFEDRVLVSQFEDRIFDVVVEEPINIQVPFEDREFKA